MALPVCGTASEMLRRLSERFSIFFLFFIAVLLVFYHYIRVSVNDDI